MAALATDGRTFDIVVIDPPSFASRQSAVPAALRAYQRLTAAGLQVLAPGGTLVQASCSARVGAEAFFAAVHDAAAASGVSFTTIEQTGHPVDHPATITEAHYLKALFLQRD